MWHYNLYRVEYSWIKLTRSGRDWEKPVWLQHHRGAASCFCDYAHAGDCMVDKDFHHLQLYSSDWCIFPVQRSMRHVRFHPWLPLCWESNFSCSIKRKSMDGAVLTDCPAPFSRQTLGIHRTPRSPRRRKLWIVFNNELWSSKYKNKPRNVFFNRKLTIY